MKYAARTRTNGLRTCTSRQSGFRGVEAHRLLAGPDGGSKPTGKPAPLKVSQTQVQADDQQEAGLAITHYKKDRLHTVYIARSRRHLSGPNLNDQQAACRV